MSHYIWPNRDVSTQEGRDALAEEVYNSLFEHRKGKGLPHSERRAAHLCGESDLSKVRWEDYCRDGKNEAYGPHAVQHLGN